MDMMAHRLHKDGRPGSGMSRAAHEGGTGTAARRGAAETRPIGQPMSHRLSLLVVEDEKPLARLWATELDRLVEATLSHTIEEARVKLRGRAFDVMLLDLHLPDGSGLDLLKEV